MTPITVAVGGNKSLLIFTSSLPGDLFTNEVFVVIYSLDRMNEIKTSLLLDIGATSIIFIDLEMARHVCDIL